MECKTCFCGKLRECHRCNNGNQIINEKCTVEPGRFCTCRLCGFAVSKDGYSGKDIYKDLDLEVSE